MRNLEKLSDMFGRRFCAALGKCALPDDVLSDLVEPQRVVRARIKVSGDSSVTGWRLCLSDLLGPTKGGVRFHQGVNEANLQSLAARILLKSAVNGLPHGGAAGGIAIDPKRLSQQQLESMAREYVRVFADFIGSDRDILSPDLGTNAKVMAWMSDELNVVRRRQDPAAINGKPPGNGGIAGRHGATAAGALVVLQELFSKWQWQANELTCAIQGLGAAGSTIAEHLAQIGVRVVAVSDSTGGWHAREGLDVREICDSKRSGIPLANLALKKAVRVAPEKVLEAPVDVVIAAALGGQIDQQVAPRMQCRAVVELANAAVTNEADAYLEAHDVTVVPDVVVNAGDVRDRLRTRMSDTTRKLLAASDEFRVSLATAAQILAIDKLRLAYGV